MPLEPSVAALLDVLPSRLAEACTPPFAVLEIEGLPPSRFDRTTGQLVCGAHRVSAATAANDWRAAARRIVRLADAAARDLNLERIAARHLESVTLPAGPIVAVRAMDGSLTRRAEAVEVMPAWAWKIDASLLHALRDLGMEPCGILACAANPGATITFPVGQGIPGLSGKASANAVGRFPIIEVTVEFRPGLSIQARGQTILKADEQFPHTVCSALAGKRLSKLVEVGIEAIDTMPIGSTSHPGRGTTVRLNTKLTQLAPVPAIVIDSLPPHMREWFSAPRWGRAPALLADALSLLAAR